MKTAKFGPARKFQNLHGRFSSVIQRFSQKFLFEIERGYDDVLDQYFPPRVPYGRQIIHSPLSFVRKFVNCTIMAGFVFFKKNFCVRNKKTSADFIFFLEHIFNKIRKKKISPW